MRSLSPHLECCRVPTVPGQKLRGFHWHTRGREVLSGGVRSPRPETIAAYCALADRMNWGLGETLEKAVELLEERYGRTG